LSSASSTPIVASKKDPKQFCASKIKIAPGALERLTGARVVSGLSVEG
jgi:hypothetical protein